MTHVLIAQEYDGIAIIHCNCLRLNTWVEHFSPGVNRTLSAMIVQPRWGRSLQFQPSRVCGQHSAYPQSNIFNSYV
ncbi:hypothetical protein [Fischerella thermalis]|uniref:hypothetical protein n=1 Tax=Fischerella thermalis TaxID=372787 RepID=UPI0011AF77D7|nr:hypothetical protein [Fischerella thermalis]